MADQIDTTTGQHVPDTATTYERAKPEKESPSQSLTTPPAQPAADKDQLARNAQPNSQKQTQ